MSQNLWKYVVLPLALGILLFFLMDLFSDISSNTRLIISVICTFTIVLGMWSLRKDSHLQSSNKMIEMSSKSPLNLEKVVRTPFNEIMHQEREHARQIRELILDREISTTRKVAILKGIGLSSHEIDNEFKRITGYGVKYH